MPAEGNRPNAGQVALVTSRNPVKVKAAQAALQRCLLNQQFAVQGVNCCSGVRDQPIGDEETLQGAINRLDAAACQQTADLLISIEGGVEWRNDSSELYCFAWAAVAAPGSGKVSKARSAEFLLPPKLAELVRGGMQLGEADDQLFQRTKSGQGSGTIGHLTSNVITRQTYYEHAVIMALLPYMNPQLYPGYR
eukprot:jgi/Chrzof1/5641/Cz16g09280.t1